MRRIASVFSSKRDKSESAGLIRHQNPQPIPPIVESPTTSIISTPQLSSGASSNGSTSLPTPEPDERPKRSWKAWLGKGKTDAVKIKSQPQWPSLPPPLLKQPPATNRKGPGTNDTEEEEVTDSDEDSAPDLGLIRQSRQTLQILIQNSLQHRISASPFLQLPDVPAYPRSCGLFPATVRQESLESSMHKKQLLHRLLDTNRPLTGAEEESILPFSSAKRVPTPLKSNSPPSVDEPAPPKLSQITQFSRGLHSWISRPCFEERYAVYTPTETGIIHQSVTGTQLCVAALEYSEGLEAMIDFSFELPAHRQHLDESPEEPETPSPSSSSSSLPHSRNPPYTTAAPSPLRNEHNPSIPSKQTNKEPQSQPTAKRGVRFAEDDKEDTIPIGYALRIKKQREQKAKFLREEKERRAFEEERRKTDAERREREKARREWERERQAWEQEKKAAEEERQKRLYQAEILATRERRETQRMGGSLRGMSSSSSSLSNPERNMAEAKRYSRPAYDGSRRQASEPGVASTSSSSPHSSSPSSSRPSSVVGHGATSLAPPPPIPTHRPSSIHSNHSMSSSEDMRSRNSSRKRNSMASISSNRFTGDLTSPYAMRSSSSTSLHSYPIPPVPMFPLDMPLLPPTAPFMLHQYPRARTNSNSNLSPSPSRRTPSNHSSERVNAPNHEANASPRQLSSSHRPTHQRQVSADNTRQSSHGDRQRSSQSSHRTPPASISRGRRPQNLSSHSQTMISPWTAPPSQSGQYGMSPSLNNSGNLTMRTLPRRQTTML